MKGSSGHWHCHEGNWEGVTIFIAQSTRDVVRLIQKVP